MEQQMHPPQTIRRDTQSWTYNSKLRCRGGNGRAGFAAAIPPRWESPAGACRPVLSFTGGLSGSQIFF